MLIIASCVVWDAFRPSPASSSMILYTARILCLIFVEICFNADPCARTNGVCNLVDPDYETRYWHCLPMMIRHHWAVGYSRLPSGGSDWTGDGCVRRLIWHNSPKHLRSPFQKSSPPPRDWSFSWCHYWLVHNWLLVKCGPAAPRKYVLTSLPLVSVRRHGRANSVNVEIKFHLEFKLRFPSAQLMLRQMHLTNVSESIKAKCWVSWLGFDV